MGVEEKYRERKCIPGPDRYGLRCRYLVICPKDVEEVVEFFLLRHGSCENGVWKNALLAGTLFSEFYQGLHWDVYLVVHGTDAWREVIGDE